MFHQFYLCQACPATQLGLTRALARKLAARFMQVDVALLKASTAVSLFCVPLHPSIMKLTWKCRLKFRFSAMTKGVEAGVWLTKV